jgi:sugar lactone lactonase YvrE
MARFVSTTAAFAVLAAAVVLAAPAAAPFPARIDFPDGWRAEGIAAGHGNTFYAGNTATGSVFKGDVRTGEGSVLVPGVTGRSALGLTLDDWNRLWVAGGTGGGGGRHAYVYDADTGALIQDITLTTAAGFGTINDVVAMHDAVWFTNTNNAANPQANVLFKVPLGTQGEIGAPEMVPISFFGANGIEATPNGKTLIVVSIGQSKYYRVDVETGETEEIVLDQAAPRGDGLILQGHTLYSVLNLPNAAFPGLTAEIAVIRLSPDYATGEVVDHLNDPNEPLVNSATADLWGNRIYVVTRNTPFGPTTFNHLARIDKHGND